MKRIVLAFAMLLTCHGLSAQHLHDHEFNKNITPYHDAADAKAGITAVDGLKKEEWKQFAAKYPSWGARFGTMTQLPHRAFGKPITFTPGGQDPVAKAKAFIQQELAGYQIQLDELVLQRNAKDDKYVTVEFKQFHENKEVLWSRIMVRFTHDLKIMMFGLDYYRNITDYQITITPNDAIQAAEKSLSTTVLNSDVSSSMKLFPLPADQGLQLRPVYEIEVNTQDDQVTPGKYLVYVDAVNGQILYRTNRVKEIGFTMKANAYPSNLFSPIANLPLPHLKVVQGSTTYYTDANGYVALPSAGPWNATPSLQGRWCKIVTGANGTTSDSYSIIGANDGDSITYTSSTPNATERHLTCYYHTNVVHDFMKTKFPTFTGLDIALTTRVDRTDGNCNAFYNGNSINFYTTAAGCNALSLVNTVVYHEYGHGISDKYWTANSASFDNGGMGEGYSDVWAMCITKNPVVGAGFFINQPNSFIRRYDQTPKIYPQDIVGEVHADGEIIAGAWWDVAIDLSQNMSLSAAVDSMGQIYARSMSGFATGPDGTEGQVYFDILIDALTYDDDNANIYDGTPSFVSIVKGFARHGIYLLSDTKIDNHTVTMHNSGTAVNVSATVTASFQDFIGSVKMFYRLKNTTALDSLVLTNSSTLFSTTFPGGISSSIYEYYFVVEDMVQNKSAYGPVAAPFSTQFSQRNIPYYLAFGYEPMMAVDFESPLQDWTVANYADDNATAGLWTVALPIASRTSTTGGDTVQTGHDHTTGSGKCAVTGNASSSSYPAGSADVDNGKTSILSQEFDLTGMTKPMISYWRWFSNSQGQNPRKDRWRVYLQYPNSSYLIERTYQPDVSWRENLLWVDPSIGTKVRLLFIAEDSAQNGSGTWVEAALDDITVWDLGDWPTSSSSIGLLESTIYPNPASNNITVSTPEQGSGSIRILNAVGDVVKTEYFTTTHNLTLDVSSISNGVYLLELTVNGKKVQHKITVRH